MGLRSENGGEVEKARRTARGAHVPRPTTSCASGAPQAGAGAASVQGLLACAYPNSGFLDPCCVAERRARVFRP